MAQWMTALVEPARSGRKRVGIRAKTASRIFPRLSLCMTSLIFASGVLLTSWANCLGSTEAKSVGKSSDMDPSIGVSSLGYSPVTLRVSRYAGKVTVPVQRRLPRAVREQQMLDAAVAAFSASGYHEASMDDIAAR